MSAKYWQRGETIDYTATEAVSNGDVVDLATGSAWRGTILRPMKPAPFTSWACSRSPRRPERSRWGRPCIGTRPPKYHDHSESNTPAGWAVAAAKSGDATVLVKLLG